VEKDGKSIRLALCCPCARAHGSGCPKPGVIPPRLGHRPGPRRPAWHRRARDSLAGANKDEVAPKFDQDNNGSQASRPMTTATASFATPTHCPICQWAQRDALATLVPTRGELDSKLHAESYRLHQMRCYVVLYQRRTIMDAKKKKKVKWAGESASVRVQVLQPTHREDAGSLQS
jgi:hypothetical protein